MKWMSVILFLCVQTVRAQVKVNEIRMKFGSEFHKAKEPDVTFPVMSTGNKVVDDKINFFVIKELTGQDSITDISSALFRSMNEGLSELDYEITLERNDILSYRFDARGCGAYCTNFSLYFNFDLHTGEPLKIQDVFNAKNIDSFKSMVFRDKIKALAAELKNYNSLLAAKEIDSSTYETVTSYVKENCVNGVSVDKFLLDAKGVEIIDDCEFPHVVASLQPAYKLKYPYNQIRRFINPTFFEKVNLSNH